MNSSVNFRSRKRKQCSSSNPLNSRFTRSKSQMHVHRSRSGRTWRDTPARKPSRRAHLLLDEPVEKPSNVHRLIPENGSSMDLSIKDLRARARRVFSPASVVEEKIGKFDEGIGFVEEGCSGAPKVLDNWEDLDLEIAGSDMGVKNSDIDSDLGFASPGKEELGDGEDAGSVSKDAVPVLGLESHGQPDKEEDVNLNQKTPVVKKKNEENKVESGKDCSESKRNGSISGSRSVLNPSSKRTVFKAPSSFSYRRLLPFLMEMAKDDSSISEIDVVDVGYHCKVQKSNNVDSNLSSAFTECVSGNPKHNDRHSDHSKTLDEGDYWSSRIQLPIKGQDLDDPAKTLAMTEGDVGMPIVEQSNHENRRVDELVEEFVQTTPPDDTIFSKRDNDNAGASHKTNARQSGIHVLEKPLNKNNVSNSVSTSMKSHPARKSNTLSNAKPVLNPCSRSKIFKSSSFSYRRLLPFLTDVAKSTANVDQSPKFQREESDSHSASRESVDENIPVNRRRIDDFPGYQEAEDKDPSARPVNPPICGSSNDISPNLSVPLFNSEDSPLHEKSNAASSEAIAKPDMPLLARTSANEGITSDSSGKLEIAVPTDNIKSCHSEISSAETSCSAINHEPLTTETKSEVSQVSENEPIDVGMALDLDYHKNNLKLIKSVSLYQSSLEIKEFDHQGNPIDSPKKGILKRNPRGCRGLCNCLNCSSFRLHAERSFEFSKNQMLDAEEVAQGLIDELAELRNLLEKSVFGGSDLFAIQVNQAKEACQKALRREQLAKSRLSQMNDDLNVHCRITSLQRPRVTFSRYIEEIAIPKTDLSASPNPQKQDEKQSDKLVKPALSKDVFYTFKMPAGSRCIFRSSTSDTCS